MKGQSTRHDLVVRRSSTAARLPSHGGGPPAAPTSSKQEQREQKIQIAWRNILACREAKSGWDEQHQENAPRPRLSWKGFERDSSTRSSSLSSLRSYVSALGTDAPVALPTPPAQDGIASCSAPPYVVPLPPSPPPLPRALESRSDRNRRQHEQGNRNGPETC